MADQSTQSILIDAEPADVMAVIGDFESYPEWAEAVKGVQVLEEHEDGWAKSVAFDLDAGVVKDKYTLAYVWDGDRKVSWTLTKGQMQKAQNGSYTLVPKGAQTEVTYNLSVELSIPMLGALRRRAEKVIMDTALKELKRRVES